MGSAKNPDRVLFVLPAPDAGPHVQLLPIAGSEPRLYIGYVRGLRSILHHAPFKVSVR